MGGGGNFCSNLLGYYPMTNWFPNIPGDPGIIMFASGQLNIFMSVLTMVWIKNKEIKSKRYNEDEESASNVIFPLFVKVLWMSVVVNIYSGLMISVLPINPIANNSLQVAAAYSLMKTGKHCVIEGIAFLLMQKGCGSYAASRAGRWTAAWGCVMFVANLLIYREGGNLFDVCEIFISCLLLCFYSALWLASPKILFRRPAVFNYARFWVFYRLCVLLSDSLRFSPDTDDFGICTYIFVTLVVLSATQPVVCYYTLLQDSRWWQGAFLTGTAAAGSSSSSLSNNASFSRGATFTGNASNRGSSIFGYNNDDDEEEKEEEEHNGINNCDIDAHFSELNTPLLGSSEFSLQSAQFLASSMDKMALKGGVKMLNFAMVRIDHSTEPGAGVGAIESTYGGSCRDGGLIGSGSFSKVYKGFYKKQQVAIKLIFSIDLTVEHIKRVATEASILSSIRHPNVVTIVGVCVLPPSVCLVLEYCQFGSLSDIIHSAEVVRHPFVSGSSTTTSLGESVSNVRNRHIFSTITSSSSASSVGSSHAHLSSSRCGDSSSSSSSPYSSGRPMLKLSTIDKLYLALGCARGLAAVHSYSAKICHRDVKSFNFLVDSQFTVKISDLELGSADENSKSKSSNLAGERIHASGRGSGEFHIGNSRNNIYNKNNTTSTTNNSKSETDSGGSSVAANRRGGGGGVHHQSQQQTNRDGRRSYDDNIDNTDTDSRAAANALSNVSATSDILTTAAEGGVRLIKATNISNSNSNTDDHDSAYDNSSSAAAAAAAAAAQQEPTSTREEGYNNRVIARQIREEMASGAYIDIDSMLLNWVAPEVLRHSSFIQASDVYAFGTVLWEIFTGKVPFDSFSRELIESKLLSDNNFTQKVSPELRSTNSGVFAIIDDCWSIIPSKRLTAKQCVQRLESLLYTEALFAPFQSSTIKAPFKTEAFRVAYVHRRAYNLEQKQQKQQQQQKQHQQQQQQKQHQEPGLCGAGVHNKRKEEVHYSRAAAANATATVYYVPDDIGTAEDGRSISSQSNIIPSEKSQQRRVQKKQMRDIERLKQEMRLEQKEQKQWQGVAPQHIINNKRLQSLHRMQRLQPAIPERGFTNREEKAFQEEEKEDDEKNGGNYCEYDYYYEEEGKEIGNYVTIPMRDDAINPLLSGSDANVLRTTKKAVIVGTGDEEDNDEDCSNNNNNNNNNSSPKENDTSTNNNNNNKSTSYWRRRVSSEEMLPYRVSLALTTIHFIKAEPFWHATSFRAQPWVAVTAEFPHVVLHSTPRWRQYFKSCLPLWGMAVSSSSSSSAPTAAKLAVQEEQEEEEEEEEECFAGIISVVELLSLMYKETVTDASVSGASGTTGASNTKSGEHIHQKITKNNEPFSLLKNIQDKCSESTNAVAGNKSSAPTVGASYARLASSAGRSECGECVGETNLLRALQMHKSSQVILSLFTPPLTERQQAQQEGGAQGNSVNINNDDSKRNNANDELWEHVEGLNTASDEEEEEEEEGEAQEADAGESDIEQQRGSSRGFIAAAAAVVSRERCLSSTSGISSGTVGTAGTAATGFTNYSASSGSMFSSFNLGRNKKKTVTVASGSTINDGSSSSSKSSKSNRKRAVDGPSYSARKSLFSVHIVPVFENAGNNGTNTTTATSGTSSSSSSSSSSGTSRSRLPLSPQNQKQSSITAATAVAATSTATSSRKPVLLYYALLFNELAVDNIL